MTITPEDARQIVKKLYYDSDYESEGLRELAVRLKAHAESDSEPLPELGKDRVWARVSSIQGHTIVRAKSKTVALGMIISAGEYFSHYTMRRFNGAWRETHSREHLAAAQSPGVFEKRNGEWLKLGCKP